MPHSLGNSNTNLGTQINPFSVKVDFCRHLEEWSLNHLWRHQFARQSTFQISNWHSVDWSFHRTMYLNIDCILTELIEKNTLRFWCKIGAWTGQHTCNWSTSPFQGLMMIFSKLFLPERRMWRVKRNEDKKAGKKKEEKEQEKIWNGFTKKRN